MIRKCVFFPIVTVSEFPIYGHSREGQRWPAAGCGYYPRGAAWEHDARGSSLSFLPRAVRRTRLYRKTTAED